MRRIISPSPIVKLRMRMKKYALSPNLIINKAATSDEMMGGRQIDDTPPLSFALVPIVLTLIDCIAIIDNYFPLLIMFNLWVFIIPNHKYTN
jgi:hypothetical protein